MSLICGRHACTYICRPQVSSSEGHPPEARAVNNEYRANGGGGEVAGEKVEPLLHQGEDRLEPQGSSVRVRDGGDFWAEERDPARVQPCVREDPCPHPPWQAHLRVHDHPSVHRRRLGPQPVHPPFPPLRPRHRSLLGHIPR